MYEDTDANWRRRMRFASGDSVFVGEKRNGMYLIYFFIVCIFYTVKCSSYI